LASVVGRRRREGLHRCRGVEDHGSSGRDEERAGAPLTAGTTSGAAPGRLRDGYDVVIAGGGAIGSAVAYFLAASPDFAGSILVVEPDPSYREAASTRSASSIRRQFSTPINIALSAFGLEFLRDAPQRLTQAAQAAAVNVALVESTYLYLATPRGRSTLEQRVAIQHSMGVKASLHDRAALSTRYPWLNTEDIAAGCDTACGEGWFDGHSLLSALRASSQALGVTYRRDRVTGLERRGGVIAAVALESGVSIGCRFAVNATGTRSRALAASAGVELPVFARKRNVFVFSCATPIPRCPLVIDPSGLWFRPEGQLFLCGPPEHPDPDVSPDDFDVDLAVFEERAWPILAHRVPAFEAIRRVSAWAGHYDYNTFDQNAFIGPVPGVDNLLLASGFSGHGIQHAPAIGRALSEYICYGEYRTIDLAPLSYARYPANAPLRELNVI
jgi:glycine/D-amino acid oxidase-like deaminating enzyme